MRNFKKGLALIMVFVFGFSIMAFAESTSATTIVMKIGSSQAIYNNEEIVISRSDPSVTPVIVDGLTYVPLEFINLHFNTAVDTGAVKTITQDDIILAPLRKLAEEQGYNVYYKDGVIVISGDKNAKTPSDKVIGEYAKRLSGLPVVGTNKKLHTLLGEEIPQLFSGKPLAGSSGGAPMGIAMDQGAMLESSVPTAQAAAPAAAPTMGTGERQKDMADSTVAQEAGFSGTNTQVKGVDEGDIIKTDGKYIYFSPGAGNYVSIVKALPRNEMKEVKRIEFGDYYISDMYLSDNQLIVIANGYKNVDEMPAYATASPSIGISDSKLTVRYMMPYYMGQAVTKAFVYDTSNMDNVKEVKTFEIDGNINSSRKIGDNLYLITQSYVNHVGISDGEYKYDLPSYKDSATNKEKDISLAQLFYLPEAINQSVTTISGIKLNDLKAEAVMISYLGNSETIYMSTENLYITTTSYNYNNNRAYAPSNHTNIYKFALDNSKVTFSSRGKVEGTILNQFAMDEYDGHFRIATTTWINNGGRSNNMFVLDKNMNKTGQITNIAPNENIYSVRFLGDKAHMVTFEVVDPLFVIDLKNPAKPTILGELKIPGYSTYLHPYDENHLIGFGYDADNDGNTRGLKLSMFDISDLSNPKEKFTTVIGDRGSHSELLYNHKALLFSKEKNIFAFPLEVRTLTPAEKNDRWAYGKFAFQGAYVYSIDMEKGFVLDGSISNNDSKTEGNYNEYVQRILYIEDTLYTASNQSIVATDLNSFARQGKVEVN